jgi:gliding motility-associated-like protein
MGGIYQVTANYNFNGIPCPRQATTQINVVQTNPVSVAASPGTVLCQGDKLSLSAGAGAAYAYAWVGPSGFNSSISNPTIFPITGGNGGVYTVTAYFTNNFITCTTFNTVNISIVPVTPPIISMPSSACQNSTVNVSAVAGTGAGYEWFGPGFSSLNQSTVIAAIQPSNAGTYYVTAKYSAGSTTCAATASTQLNVVQLNSVSVIPPQPVCQPDNAYLQANSTGAISYQWVGPNSYSASGSNVTVYYPTPAASGVYTVTASFGNSSLICKNTNTVSLTVSPVLNFSLIPRQQTCYNSSVQVLGPAGADTYTWTSSTGFTSNDKDITFPSIQPGNAGTYTVNVNLGPCITSGSTTIEVLTPISFTLIPKDRTVCRGDTVMLAAGVTGGSENYAYLWNPSIYMDSPTGPAKTIVPLGTVIYNVNVHDIACPHFTLSQSFSVNVNQPPQPTIQLPQSEGCVPFCTSYKADTTGEAAIVTYDFGGLRKFQSDTSFTYCLDQPGTYTLTVLSKGTNGCSGKFVYPYPLVVNPKPGGDIFWSPEKPTTADEVTFYARYSYEPVIYHNWQFSGGEPSFVDTAAITGPGTDTTNADNPKRKYNIYGKYPVMLISKNDRECTDTVVKFIDVIDDLNVYIPNSFTPNGDGINDEFGVKGMGIKPEGFSMELCDRAGATFFKTKDINERWDGTIKGEKAMNGIYIYKVRAVGMNGEGRREYIGFFTLLK